MSKFFMIGINGAGVSSLACIIKDLGNDVVGSDTYGDFFTQEFLDKSGIKKYIFNEYDFDSDYIVVAGNSFASDFPELAKAYAQGNKILYYHEFLGELSKSSPSVAVTGTHGKTTTTTMLRDIMSINNDVSYLIGDGHGKGKVDAKYFVFEACEYKNHFHSYFPKYAIITNVGHDHIDFFPTVESYNKSFTDFAKNVTDKIVVCADDENAYELFKELDNVVFYGMNDKSFARAMNVEYSHEGSKFDLYFGDEYVTTYNTQSFGKHNVLNLLAALTVAYLEGEDVKQICDVYNGKIKPKRRFEEYFYNEQIVIDDYAHHPDEVRSFLDSVHQKYPNHKTMAVFEPYTIERLLEYQETFSIELNRCDEQLIMPVKIPLRDGNKFDGGHVESDIMLEYLNNGKFYDENSYDYLLTKREWIVLFIGSAISDHTQNYISKCNLHFTKK